MGLLYTLVGPGYASVIIPGHLSDLGLALEPASNLFHEFVSI
jgi:hypothetical protein